MKKITSLFLLMLVSILPLASATFSVIDYGAVGDGKTDDGIAIQNALTALSVSSDVSNTLMFEANKVYYANNIDGVFLLNISNQSDVIIDAQGATFLLGSSVRYVHSDNTSSMVIKNLNVDYEPLPFFEGDVIAVNSTATKKYVDIRVDPAFELPSLGVHVAFPSEQAYFGYMWSDLHNTVTGKDYGAGHHYYVTEISETYIGSRDDRIVRVYTGGDNEYTAWKYVVADETRATIPIEGLAHIGGASVFDIVECTDVLLQNINIWSAPWFATRITRCLGYLTYDNVNIAPKTGTNRRLSSWRDGIHVKSNYATLLFKNCLLKGMGDDAFNIATFMSNVNNVLSSSSIIVKQVYPLNVVPYNSGDVVQVYDVVKGKYLGRSRVSYSTGFVQTGTTPAPSITLSLQTPVEGMNTGCVIWNETSANPNTTLKACEIYRSCRFQSAVTIDSCDLSALAYFRCENVEGPISVNSVIKNSTLCVDGVVQTVAVGLSTTMSEAGTVYEPTEYPLQNILFQNNTIKGKFNCTYCKNMAIINNNFVESASKIYIKNSVDFLFRDNTINGRDLSGVDQINFLNGTSSSSITVEQSIDKTQMNILKPFAHWQAYLTDGSTYEYNAIPDLYRPEFVSNVSIGTNVVDAYSINVPSLSFPISKVSLEVFPQEESETLFFWTYLPSSGSAKLDIVTTDGEGQTAQVYTTSLTGGFVQGHTISIPTFYYANQGNMQIFISTGDNMFSDHILYLGNNQDIPLPVGEVDYSKRQQDILQVKTLDSNVFEVNVSHASGQLNIYSIDGKLLSHTEVTTTSFTVAPGLVSQESILIFSYISEYGNQTCRVLV